MPPTANPAGSSSAAPLCCPVCSEEFQPRRRDQKYCSKKCAKVPSRNTCRSVRTAERKRANMEHYSAALALAAMLYGAPPCERLGVMKEIIDSAASGDSRTRRVLTDLRLLRASPNDVHLFHRRAPGAYRTISQAANAYTRKFFGVSIQDFLKQAREGDFNKEHEVRRSAKLGAVPRLNKIRKARCWHRPLPDEKTMHLRRSSTPTETA